MNEKQETKYQLILDAAFEQMKENGFEKASVSQIVKRAGVAQGTFYLYFDSKSAIVPAIAERILCEQMDAVRNEVRDGDDILSIVRVLIDQTFALTDQHREVIKFCYSGIAYYDSFQRWEDIYRPYYEWVELKLQEAMEKKEIPPLSVLSYQAKLIIGIIEQSAETYYLASDPTKDENVDIYKEELFQFIKRALS